MVYAPSPNAPRLRAPFPWPGGKSAVAADVWARFGDPANYIEPFFGSGAVLLKRPAPPDGARRIETVNDMDGLLVNFWRAVKADPEAVASFADWPVFEIELHARHRWLVARKPDLAERLVADPDWFDAQAAGWWLWGVSCWIGPDFAAPRHAKAKRPIPRGDPGWCYGSLPTLTGHGRGVNVIPDPAALLAVLSERLRRVRVTCGDWRRVLTPAVTLYSRDTAVFLDPPYKPAGRYAVYAHESDNAAIDAGAWAAEHGDELKIALCGYDGEHDALEAKGWSVFRWKANGGYGNQRRTGDNPNAARERIWFSPRCHAPGGLFN